MPTPIPVPGRWICQGISRVPGTTLVKIAIATDDPEPATSTLVVFAERTADIERQVRPGGAYRLTLTAEGTNDNE